MHLIAIILPKDVIELLLRKEPVSIRIYPPESVHYLLEPVVFDHDLQEFILGYGDASVDLLPVDPVPMKITHISGWVHLELNFCIWDLEGIVKILGRLLLYQVSQWLHRDDTSVGNVVYFVQFLDDCHLLVAQFETELSKDSE